MSSKIKVFVSIITVIALITTGTMAWVNFSQNAVNEFQGDGTKPGGTTHDDFDEPNKDVYIENWGEIPIYVRIRLDEYMEIGTGAGLKGTLDSTTGEMIPNPNNKAVSLIPGASINDLTTWQPHIPSTAVDFCAAQADFHKYWDWQMGGSKIYMPAPEANRTNPAYVDQNSKAYNSLTDEAGLKQTLNAAVITMAEWNAMGQPIGNYWVIDADGWAYWAAPLQPGEATGLLLDSVAKIYDIEDSYYYAINVIAQMATKTGDNNYTDFYDNSDGYRTATDNGKALLDIIVNGSMNNFSAQYIYTNGNGRYDEDRKIVVIESKEQLDDYYLTNRQNDIFELNKYNFDEGISYNALSFKDAIGKYDDNYFKDNILVLVIIVENSLSISHVVKSIDFNPSNNVINIGRIKPSVQLGEIATWHIIIEIGRNDCSNKNFELNVTDIVDNK